MSKKEEATEISKNKDKGIIIDRSRKVAPMIFAIVGLLIMLCQWIVSLNLITLIGAVYMCLTALIITIALIAKKRLYIWYLIGYVCVSFGIFAYYVINGADAGWGAFVTGKSGFASANNYLWQGEGNFGTRLAGNLLLCSPAFILLVGLYVFVYKWEGSRKSGKGIAYTLSVLLTTMSVIFVFVMNLRSNPRVFDMSAGHDEYLGNVKKTADKNSPNVLFVLMDDMGYGDTSYNANKAGITPAFQTPNIDSIAEGGCDFDNFYANYSVCSPSRFAAMTGRYPYRGYADNVMYPTVNTINPLSTTRVFNSFEMGANCDGMLGDEVTMAESLKAAGYATGAFGKWHLGDFGQYLPTNQGFDYFYGSHHINDNTPYYHVREGGDLGQGNYEIVHGTDIDQANNTAYIHSEIDSWIRDQVASDNSFFAYYATPWPHAPVHAGYDFQGTTGAGVYADCIVEFDTYLGKLFDTLKELGVYDDTIIIFTSDNGPALQGSTNELRGGKYTAYEAGQKVPFYMQWNNAPKEDYAMLQSGSTVYAPAAMADLFPTLAYMCNVTDGVKRGYMPSDVDRAIDGVSMVPLLQDTTGKVFIHDYQHPILHMKREKIKAVQYSVTTDHVLESVKGYKFGADWGTQTADEEYYATLPLIKDNDYLTFKYFRSMSNDNPAFPDKQRKNWLICLTDDPSESYQRADVFPDIAKEYNSTMSNWTKEFKSNRRGVYSAYYKK
ncbi:MAG: sulfatase-like hydrolase/transferase [Clostridia bacterium]|nr:sulfatase-like hydrolase/transferase [Clostridia bacterium]